MAFDITVPVASESRIPKPSDNCKCGQPCVVRHVVVVNQNTGERREGAASEYLFWKHTHKGQTDWDTLEEKGNWVYQDWINYCTGCWTTAKKDGLRKYTDDQVRVAWRWLIGELSKDSESMPFKQIKLNNDQRDTAIEIVNYEAHRTNQPEAIPAEYKLAEVWT